MAASTADEILGAVCYLWIPWKVPAGSLRWLLAWEVWRRRQEVSAGSLRWSLAGGVGGRGRGRGQRSEAVAGAGCLCRTCCEVACDQGDISNDKCKLLLSRTLHSGAVHYSMPLTIW
jgi:hypothetical protein